MTTGPDTPPPSEPDSNIPLHEGAVSIKGTALREKSPDPGIPVRHALRFEVGPVELEELEPLYHALKETTNKYLVETGKMERAVQVPIQPQHKPFDFSAHEKFLLFTGLMYTMADKLEKFTVEQVREMNALSAESRKSHGITFDKADSPEVLMNLARRLAR